MTGNTRFARLGFEAAVDVGIVVLAHFRNPARRYAAQLLLDALTLKKRILIPVSSYLGAYVIMTRYLKLRSDRVAKALLKTLSVESPAFYENINKTVAEKALASASELNISSWDCYLIELAKELEINKIYTIDEELKKKIKDVKIENPIPKNIMKEYHQYIQGKIT
ncbi:type II toxin-antitoxin system VapC family toxin [Candidatus Bathyarchaeota archaeon]|nr:type II toxin-antitoxin system VapC family toxin [Candidatus Bathyarchaeota archaeon]